MIPAPLLGIICLSEYTIIIPNCIINRLRFTTCKSDAMVKRHHREHLNLQMHIKDIYIYIYVCIFVGYNTFIISRVTQNKMDNAFRSGAVESRFKIAIVVRVRYTWAWWKIDDCLLLYKEYIYVLKQNRSQLFIIFANAFVPCKRK